MSAIPFTTLTLKSEYCEKFRKEAKSRFGRGYIKGLLKAINETLLPEERISEYTVSRILNGTPVRSSNMQLMCDYFGMDWDDVCKEGEMPILSEIDDLVQQICDKIKFDFSSRTLASRKQHSNQWLLNNFIELNLLEVDYLPAEYPVVDPSVLIDDGISEENEFDRKRLRLPRSKNITLRKALEKHHNIFVYGDPGSGKTSCLEWLALKCRSGEIFKGYVPIFLGSRRFATANKSETLLTFFERMFIQWGFSPTDLNKVLEAGRAVFIFDGLDETPASERERMEIMVDSLIRNYQQCHFIFSSRLGILFPFSGNFQKVLIAPLKKPQIQEFVTHWFAQQGKDPGLGILMIQKLNSTSFSGIKELSQRPVLLELLCVVFEGIQNFPQKRFDIFKSGIQRMTRKNIQIETDISELAVLRESHIYNILCRVASYFFIDLKCQIIFPTLAVERSIREYFKESRSINKNDVPARNILQGIEQSNGLLMRWADDYCSFSHLTYQEFFTAEYLVESGRYKEVYNYIQNPRWHFVTGLIAECLPYEKTWGFFNDFKDRIDSDVNLDTNITSFLDALDKAAKLTLRSIRSHQPNIEVYIRAWYFVYALQEPGIVTNKGPRNLYFDLPDFDYATSTVNHKKLDCHGLVYKIYHRLHKREMRAEPFTRSLEQLVRLLSGDIKNTEVIKGWLNRISREQLKYDTTDTWWADNYDNWNERMIRFIKTLGLPSIIDLTQTHKDKLRSYYNSTRLLSICMNRSQLNDLQRQEISNTMLLLKSLP